MPADKQTNGHTNKPITPALSSRFRSTKTPLAPRLAGSTPASPATTVRKDLRGQTLSPAAERTQAPSLNVNITPRSGARNTRISTESPATPIQNRRLSGSSSISAAWSAARQGTAINSPSNNPYGPNRLATKASSPNISTARRTSGASTISRKDEESKKFIRANDAKPALGFQSPKSTASPRPLATSLLKNGSPRAARSTPPSVISTRKEGKDENFVRANDAQIRTAQSHTVIRKQSVTSMTSNTARTRSPELTRAQSYPQPRPLPRTQHTSGKVNTTPMKTPVPAKQIPPQSSPAVMSPSSPSNRRLSFESNASSLFPIRPLLHKKAASVSSFRPLATNFVGSPPSNIIDRIEQTWIPPTVIIPLQHNTPAIPTSDASSPRSASLASSRTIGTSVTSDTDVSEVSKSGLPYVVPSRVDILSQPSQTSQPQNTPLAQAQMNASHARRERKVLDLEISNSSLLAINKTLEKELRKQSAELRRFRRLSRSGRLSFAPSNRSVSGQSAISLDTLQEQTEDEDDDYSDEDDEDSDMDGFDEELDDSIGDSPGATNIRARRRARDEQRLMLDLAKHQQLLIDSQKLTQSIKKCLNISEDLIKEANQALKYKVGIGDIKLGGRVLSAEDSDGDEDLDNQPHQPEVTGTIYLSSPSTQSELQKTGLRLPANYESDRNSDRHLSSYREPG